jgi:Family of unknown function (DUF6352)
MTLDPTAEGPIDHDRGRRDFWKSAGMHLLTRDANGWLGVTPDYICAYLTRPEVHPVDTSCDAEVRLHEQLLADPFRAVTDAEITAMKDADAIEAYRIVLSFRDLLVRAKSVEAAYVQLMQAGNKSLPPVFIDQMVHVILRNCLDSTRDPFRLRAAELFFREQTVSTDKGRLMLADEEIVEMHARAGSETGLAQLLAETGTPVKTTTLDVLDDDNKAIYWARSDRFDTVIDFRFEQPALDAFARVVEIWLAHLMRLEVRVEPRPKLEDPDWRWHIGLDANATRILNSLYENKPVPLDDVAQIVGLFRMRFRDERNLIDRVRGKPIYLGLAMNAAKRLHMKPQNLLTNLPVRTPS